MPPKMSATFLAATLTMSGLLLLPRAHAQCEIQLAPADGAGLDAFGESVAIKADRIVVGAPGDDDGRGAAYVFGLEDGSWVEQQKLQAGDAQADDAFGAAIALEGDLLVVGAPLAGSGAERFGAVYVYRFDGTVWTEEQKLQPADPTFDDSFGAAVALSDPVILVGSPDDDDAGASSGSAYLFRFDGSSWVEEAKLVSPDGEAADAFGSSVALQGDLAVAGAPGDDDLGDSAGAAHPFRYDGTTWVHEQKLTASTGSALDFLGWTGALAVDGNLILAGAHGHAAGGERSGVAYLFAHDGATWSEQLELIPSDTVAGQLFGRSVALADGMAVIGASGDATLGSRAGAAYVWIEEAGTWREERKLVSVTGGPNDLLGQAVATDGLQALAGAPQADGTAATSGSASLFDRAAWTNYGEGWPGSEGIPQLVATELPVAGTTITLELGNSLGATTNGVLFVGLSDASITGGLGGTLLVLPMITAPILVPAAGLSLPADIPLDLEGFTLYMQALEADPGASNGVSFTPGLRLRVCGW